VKKTFTLSMAWLHTWCGLVFGWVLFGVMLTGAVSVFYGEITYWLTPEIRGGLHPDPGRAMALGFDYLQAHAPKSRMWRVTLPTTREPAIKLSWREDKGGTTARQLDPETGAEIARLTEGGTFFVQYHYMLHIDRNRNPVGLLIVGLATIAMLVAGVSGIVIHKRIFRDLFLFRPGASRHRAWLDAHNVLAVLPMPFHVMIAYTGLVLLYWLYVPAAVQTLYHGDTARFRGEAIFLDYSQVKGKPGAPAPMVPPPSLAARAEADYGAGKTSYVLVRDPNRTDAVIEFYRVRTDRVSQQVPQVAFDGAGRPGRQVLQRTPVAETQAFVAALHYLEWGGPAVRWVYFLAGMAGAGMVAAGLVVFTQKRERRAKGDARWLRMVHALNVAAVAGLCVACAGFLWAERLTPVGVAHRAEVPVQAFFWIWLAALVHAGLRPPRRAWTEQLLAAALLCIGAPLLGGLVLRDAATLDWVRLGVDATLVGLGAGLGLIAWRQARAPMATPADLALAAEA
jgi:uncharacterized iron-regulated membrane protein